MIDLNRRSLITGMISLVAAPAIVRAGNLMPVKVMAAEPLSWNWEGDTSFNLDDIVQFGKDRYHICITAGVTGTGPNCAIFKPLALRSPNNGPSWLR